MKKRTKIILIAVPVVLIVLWLVLSAVIGAAATTAVETVLPKITKTDVKLESFSLSIFSGKGSIKGFIIGNMPQVLGSFKTVTQTTSPYLVFNGIVFLVVILSVLTYFFFSVEHSKHPTVRRSANLGRWFIMVYLGAIFGTTVMGRMSLFIQRLMFLLEEFPRTFTGG